VTVIVSRPILRCMQEKNTTMLRPSTIIVTNCTSLLASCIHLSLLLISADISFSQQIRQTRSTICVANFGTTYNENLMVFITVQNLVLIALVSLIIQKFEYFARLA